MNKNFLEHNIKKLLSSDWGIECNAPFRHVFRSGKLHEEDVEEEV